MEKINKDKIIALRHELHEAVFDKVTSTEHESIRVVREPNKSKKQPAPKLIVVIKDEEQAQILKKACLNLIANANNAINEELKDRSFLHYKIKYNINIIHSEGNILFSVKEAQSRHKMQGSKIKSELQTLCGNKNSSSIEHLIKKIDDKTDYIFAIPSGSSYRVTYFDGNCRHQISVGNLLIIIGNDIQILNTPSRKRRSDKKDWLYSATIPNFGAVYIYPS